MGTDMEKTKRGYRFIGNGLQNGAKELFKDFAHRSSAIRFAKKNNYRDVEEYQYGFYVPVKSLRRA